MESKKNVIQKTIIVLLLLMGVTNLSAQILINAPTPADNPNLSGNSPWTAICAGNSGFNEYFVNVTWTGTTNSGNEFILELSDSSGDFSSATELAKTSTQNANTDFDLQFAIPTTTRGQGYRMRVRSTNPAATGSVSDAYNMYYMDVTTNLNISELGNGVPPGTICNPTSVFLQVDNIANPETYQYIWYRSGTELTGEKGHTITATTSGMYNAIIDYGPICTGSGNTDSNIVDVTIGSSSNGISINPPSKTALCTGESETLSINITDPNWSYQWFKNNISIPGAIASTYTVDAANPGFEGDYQIEITPAGGCPEMSTAVTMSNADNFTVTRVNPENIVVLPSQPETLSVTTTAISPTYQWYRNNNPIPSETNSSLNITQDGTYHVSVTQGGGACPGTIKNSENTIAVVPASFEIVVDYQSAYTSCVSTTTQLEMITINAIDGSGTKTDVTTALQNDFNYQWQIDGTDVSGATSSSISLATPNENGIYTLNANLATYNEVSNTLPVQLLTSETLAVNSTSTVYCSSGDTVTITTTTDLTGASFSWEKDEVSVNTSSEALTVSDTGIYRLVVDRNGCSLTSNEISITPLDPNLISMDIDGDVVFPEGSSRSVTASGGTAYRWLNQANTEISTSSSFTFTEEGSYTLIANIDNCEIVRPINVVYQDLFNVPNVITPNGDGANDQWVIPNSYSNKSDVNVIIYNDKGEEIVNELSYQNNWPSSSTSFPKQNMVFYYVIKNTSETLKQGTITVIR